VDPSPDAAVALAVAEGDDPGFLLANPQVRSIPAVPRSVPLDRE